MEYPTELTTSDWVDYLDTLTSHDEKIACLATYHRRIAYTSVQTALAEVVHTDPKVQGAITKVTGELVKQLSAPKDYRE